MCILRSPNYANPNNRGLYTASSVGDGYTMELSWNQAYQDSLGFVVAYNIYYSTIRDDVFSEDVKFVVTSPTTLFSSFYGFTPGDTFYFAVKATEFDTRFINFSLLPDGYPDAPPGVKVYPSGLLTRDMTIDDIVVPVMDVDLFPSYGIVQVGDELIRYNSIDISDGYLIVAERGFYETDIREHLVDGYDGYHIENPLVRFWRGFEDDNTVVFQSESKFSYPNELHNNVDGYKETFKDLLTTDLSASDAEQLGFRRYDYSGWHRTDPVQVLAGNCIGSYIGGEFYCADGYNGVGRQIRGVSIPEQNTQREELLLSTDGEPCVLVRRLWKGKVCKCMDSSRETPEARCPNCFGTGYVTGYNQYFNPKRSDGRILVRFGPTVEDLEAQEGGLESKFIPDCWTLPAPTVKDRDFLIRFNEDGIEEFRYEILNVTRQRFFLDTTGLQKFVTQRVRKYDPIYMWRAIRDTSTQPVTLTTSIGFVGGPGGIPPHTHNLVINENIVTLGQINQTTSVSQGHNHSIINGIVQEALGHTHTIIL